MNPTKIRMEIEEAERLEMIANLHAHIRQLESDLQAAPAKLMNHTARLVTMGSNPIPVIRSWYPNTSIDHLGKSPYEWLRVAHDEWVADTRQMKAQLELELLVRSRLQDAIPNVPAFMNTVSAAINRGEAAAWVACLEAIVAFANAIGA